MCPVVVHVVSDSILCTVSHGSHGGHKMIGQDRNGTLTLRSDMLSANGLISCNYAFGDTKRIGNEK
jgi:hypothetical protein